jgi:tetratricopeptide (TPR) repeat protein
MIAYGTSAGSVGLIDGTGARRWETRLIGEILALALSGDGDRCAVLSRAYGDTEGASLTCLTGTGQIGWEFHVEKRLSGLSLSPNGRYLATGAKDGSTAVYEIIPGEAAGAALRDVDTLVTVRSRYAALRESTPDEAYYLLRDALLTCPSDAAFAAEVVAARQAWLASRLAHAREAQTAHDYLAALDTLEKMLAVEPREPQATALLADVLSGRARQLLAEALRLQNAGNAATAEEVLLEALDADPFCLEARQALSDLRARLCTDADADADRLLAQGDLAAGVAALERAQSAAPTADRAKKLERAQTAMEFAAGMAAYNAKNYPQAIFQFKKVLARDAGHAEARRYLGFAESFAQDASTESLTDRFNRLE